MNLEETADFISEGLPKYQRQANLEFLEKVHRLLKFDGLWAYPGRRLIFKKTENGFDLIVDS